MNECDEYEFRFDAYTPETIPMERLAKYLVALAKLFGNESSVHFQRVDIGSTKPVMRVEKEAAPKVAHRFDDISRGVAANDAMAGFNELNNLLRDDNAVGWLNKKLVGVPESALILRFPGKELPRPIKFGPFTEPAIVDGELVRIGGKDQSAHALVIDPEGKGWSMAMDRELAIKMAAYLYKGPILRVRGDARWERQEDGVWHLMSFKVEDFDVLSDDTLELATSRLRQLQKTDWDKVDDLDGYIRASRGESDGLH